jgi:hypothetical protein
MTQRQLETFIASIQEILDRDYPHLEWRVRLSPLSSAPEQDELIVFFHARTRDFRYRCRVDRSWYSVQAAQSIRLLVADLAAEAERLLADQASMSC